MIKKFLTLPDNRRVAAWFDLRERVVVFSGNTEPQYIARDQHDYRYTHGGAAYRAACEAYWKFVD